MRRYPTLVVSLAASALVIDPSRTLAAQAQACALVPAIASFVAVRPRPIGEDASPPCSGHGGLTPGLGDRKVELRDGRQPLRQEQSRVAESDDAPSTGNLKPLAPRNV